MSFHHLQQVGNNFDGDDLVFDPLRQWTISQTMRINLKPRHATYVLDSQLFVHQFIVYIVVRWSFKHSLLPRYMIENVLIPSTLMFKTENKFEPEQANIQLDRGSIRPKVWFMYSL